uniref:EthD n=2 Tax=unclassified Rhodococcus (in: high G+C Gram-positive bacteria) TaxID=192944 RepID=A0A089FXB6_9NOCA|nr:hypothetical protein [Rhodococcus sp. B2(2014)]AKL87254.1 EthD [Rhodococcus sp. B2(2014)]QTK22468.1 EthD [Rhodococcus sp. B2]
MYQIVACYGQPTDTEAFDTYYDSTHVPLVNKLPGLVDYITVKCVSALPGEGVPYYMVATATFNSERDVKAALESAEAGKADFATGGVALYIGDEVDRT